ncbi:MAG: histidinol phosphate phosphatase domain-containing protein [Nitrospinae bacterium]|nr:histidinol phosphate phosphatase domain-containing protein [Nitrospinota bacterium]
MIDLHSHTLFSDGCLLPSELARRAEVKGYKALAFTDHVDESNYSFVIENISKVCEELNKELGIFVIPGVEITHVPPKQIAKLAEKSRKEGAKIVAVHGESIVEPVAPLTNSYALDSDIDFLAHPGLITIEEIQKAQERNIYLEITSRQGHSLSNGRVAALAQETGASMIINSDSHAPGDLIDKTYAEKVLKAAGLSDHTIKAVFCNSEALVAKVKG